MLDRQEAVSTFTHNKVVNHGHKDGDMSQKSSHTRWLSLKNLVMHMRY